MSKNPTRQPKDLSQNDQAPGKPKAPDTPGTSQPSPAGNNTGSPADGSSKGTPEQGGLRWYEVRLPHCPARAFQAASPDEAIEKFNKYSNISQTDWTHTVTEVNAPDGDREGTVTAPPAPPTPDEE